MLWFGLKTFPKDLSFEGWATNTAMFRCGFGKWLDHKGSELISGLIHWWVNNWMDYCGGSGGTETVGGSLVGGSRSLAACLGNVCLLPGPFFAFCFMAIRGWAALFVLVVPALVFCFLRGPQWWGHITKDRNLWNHEPKIFYFLWFPQVFWPQRWNANTALEFLLHFSWKHVSPTPNKPSSIFHSVCEILTTLAITGKNEIILWINFDLCTADGSQDNFERVEKISTELHGSKPLSQSKYGLFKSH